MDGAPGLAVARKALHFALHSSGLCVAGFNHSYFPSSYQRHRWLRRVRVCVALWLAAGNAMLWPEEQLEKLRAAKHWDDFCPLGVWAPGDVWRLSKTGTNVARL